MRWPLAAPGSAAWLLRHELRVAWREARFFGARGRSLLRPLLIAAALQVAFLPFGWIISRARPAEPDLLVALTGLLLAFAWAGMLAQTLVSATRVLYLRGDLDLLLSAPISPRAVLAVRALAVALAAVTSWSLLAMLLVNAMVLFGQFRWLLLYPAFAGLALAAAAVALVLTAALFEILGPRRTRVAAQVLAALLGVGIVLLLQLPGWLGAAPRSGMDTLLPALRHSVAAESILWWPARAALGEAVPLAAWLASTVGLFALVVAGLGPRFALQAAAAIGTAAPAPASRMRRATRFRPGAGAALRRKEWRLLRRDPWLVSQVVLPAVYLLPLGVLSWHGEAAMGTAGVVFVIVMIAGSLAGSLAWIAIAGEDAPELLACAPVTARRAIGTKLAAVLLPVAALTAVPVAVLALDAPAQALAAAIGAAGAMATGVLLQLWHPQAGRRREFSYRHRQAILRGLFELATNVAWGGAAALSIAAPGLALTLWGVAMALVPLLYILRWRATRGRRGG